MIPLDGWGTDLPGLGGIVIKGMGSLMSNLKVVDSSRTFQSFCSASERH